MIKTSQTWSLDQDGHEEGCADLLNESMQQDSIITLVTLKVHLEKPILKLSKHQA